MKTTHAFVLLITALLTGVGVAQTGQTTLFENVRVFDGEKVIPQTNVLVEGGVIAAVGAGPEPPAGAEVVDGSGKTLLPGLIDAHVHVFTREALEQAPVFGVTTLLDMFTDVSFAQAMREEQAAGGATGRADLFSAGTLATAPGGHGTQFGLSIPTLTGPDEADAWVEARAAEGSDWIKAVLEDGSAFGLGYPTLSEATLEAVVTAAHARDLLVVTHVSTLDDAKEAIRAGTDGLAHSFVDREPDEAVLELAVENDVFVIATLAVYETIGGEPKGEVLAENPRLEPYLSAFDLQNLESAFPPSGGASFAAAQAFVRALHARGVPILAGTDAANPGTTYGASLHRELALLTAAGLSPRDALAAATSVPADRFGLTDRGRVAQGLKADLLLVEGDPTEDITATRAIVGVWKDGVRVDRDAYRAALTAQREAAEAQTRALAEADAALVSDFEAGNPSVAFGQPWVVSTDAMAGGASEAAFRVVEGGAAGSGHALLVEGEVRAGFVFPWAGVMFMPGAEPFAGADLSSLPTLHFFAKGEGGPYRVQVFCDNLGQIPAERPFEVGPEWQAYALDLATFNGCDTGGVQAVIFSAGPGTFAFHLDEVAFR